MKKIKYQVYHPAYYGYGTSTLEEMKKLLKIRFEKMTKNKNKLFKKNLKEDMGEHLLLDDEKVINILQNDKIVWRQKAKD